MRFQSTMRLLARSNYSTSSAQNTVFLVYGANGGIGSELCRLLVDHEDAHIILAGRDVEKLSNVKTTLADPSRASVHQVDVLDPSSVDKLTTLIVKEHGTLTGVANCVGSVLLKSAHATTFEEFQSTVATNLFSSFNILKSSVKSMMKNPNGGSIVFCSSAVAMHGLSNHEAIAAAKGGIASMAKSAAATYATKNIRVNCVAPGLTRTPMTARITSSEGALKASVAMHALKRIGEPLDVASALAFFLDPKNAFITGQVLGVDGGLSSVMPSLT